MFNKPATVETLQGIPDERLAQLPAFLSQLIKGTPTGLVDIQAMQDAQAEQAKQEKRALLKSCPVCTTTETAVGLFKLCGSCKQVSYCTKVRNEEKIKLEWK